MPAIKEIDSSSVHRITSGQVVIDLQSAVKELVENSLDAGASVIEVKFKDNGLKLIEVIDNGSGISPDDYDKVALNHYTSKISSFASLSTLITFGFRGEALSSLCALSEKVVITTATKDEAPMGAVLELDRIGKLVKKSKSARQRGTTVQVSNLFAPLPVRRKEFSRNAKRELGKALGLLTAYALVPCAQENKGVKLVVTNVGEKGQKTNLIRTDGSPSLRASIASLWGSKQLDSLVELNLNIQITPEKMILKRRKAAGIAGSVEANEGDDEDAGVLGEDDATIKLQVKGLISKFAPSCGRTGTDRQFFFINGRPCNPSKVQKAINEVYHTFNATQSPFLVADFILPPDSYDVNVSPDKRTILLHSENNLIAALKGALEKAFAPSRSTYTVQTQSTLTNISSTQRAKELRERVDTSQEVEEGTSGSGSSHNGRRSFGKQHLLLESDSQSDKTSSQISSKSGSDQKERGRELSVDDNSMDDPLFLPEAVSDTIENDQRETDIAEDVTPSEPALKVQDTHVIRSSELDIPSTSSMDIASEPTLVSSQSKPAIAPDNSHAIYPSILQKSSIDLSRSRSVQLTLDTSNASWNLHEDAEGGEPPKKKQRTSTTSTTLNASGSRILRTADENQNKSKRETFWTTLSQFARPGSSIPKSQLREPFEDGDNCENSAETADEEVDDSENSDELDMIEEDPQSGQAQGQNHVGRRDSSLSHRSDSTLDVVAEDLHVDILAHGKSIDDDPLEQASAKEQPIVVDDDDDEVASEQCIHLEELDVDSQGTSSSFADPDEEGEATTSGESTPSRIEVVRTIDGGDSEASILVNLTRISDTWKALQDAKERSDKQDKSKNTSSASRLGAAASLSNTDSTSAISELSRVISKEDFERMQVIGQFNLGFIIARRRDSDDVADNADALADRLDDLFIIDQHAADEKYNFETLQDTTKIASQKLFNPLDLELTAADELVAIENLSILRDNGFDISIDEEDLVGSCTQHRGRIKLVSQPVSGNTSFTAKDLEELIFLLHDRPTGKMVRCSKARAMFAMRACRKSVMIGMPLKKRQMISIVQHMGTMDQPWNCPHGRPTMRHLVSIVDHLKAAENGLPWTDESIKWKEFL